MVIFETVNYTNYAKPRRADVCKLLQCFEIASLRDARSGLSAITALRYACTVLLRVCLSEALSWHGNGHNGQSGREWRL